MVQHIGVRCHGITRQNGAHHGVVFGKGAWQAAERAELRAAKGGEATAKRGGEVANHRVVRAGIDGLVKHLVGFGIDFRLPAMHKVRHAVMQGLQASALQRGHANGGEPGAGGFHFAHSNEHRLKLVGGDLGHHGALAWAHLDEAGDG